MFLACEQATYDQAEALGMEVSAEGALLASQASGEPDGLQPANLQEDHSMVPALSAATSVHTSAESGLQTRLAGEDDRMPRFCELFGKVPYLS